MSKSSTDHIEDPTRDPRHTEKVSALDDTEFENRPELERKLLRKLDARMLILVVIYILNYVSGVDTTSSLMSSLLTLFPYSMAKFQI